MSEEERQKLKKQVLCPGVLGLGWAMGRKEGLESLQERLEGAAAVKATTTATEHKTSSRFR